MVLNIYKQRDPLVRAYLNGPAARSASLPERLVGALRSQCLVLADRAMSAGMTSPAQASGGVALGEKAGTVAPRSPASTGCASMATVDPGIFRDSIAGLQDQVRALHLVSRHNLNCIYWWIHLMRYLHFFLVSFLSLTKRDRRVHQSESFERLSPRQRDGNVSPNSGIFSPTHRTRTSSPIYCPVQYWYCYPSLLSCLIALTNWLIDWLIHRFNSRISRFQKSNLWSRSKKKKLYSETREKNIAPI